MSHWLAGHYQAGTCLCKPLEAGELTFLVAYLCMAPFFVPYSWVVFYEILLYLIGASVNGGASEAKGTKNLPICVFKLNLHALQCIHPSATFSFYLVGVYRATVVNAVKRNLSFVNRETGKRHMLEVPDD